MDIWPDEEDAPWFDLLADALEYTSTVQGPTPDSFRAHTQVMLSEMQRGCRSISDPLVRATARARCDAIESRIRQFMAPVDPALINYYINELPPGDFTFLTADIVAADAAYAATQDSHAKALSRLQMLDEVETVEMIDTVLHIETREKHPLPVAGDALDELRGDGIVVVKSRTGESVVMARSGEIVVTATPRRESVTVRTYGLDTLTSASRVARPRDDTNVPAIERPPLGQIGPKADEALRALGVEARRIIELVRGADPKGVLPNRTVDPHVPPSSPTPPQAPAFKADQGHCDLCDLPRAMCSHRDR